MATPARAVKRRAELTAELTDGQGTSSKRSKSRNGRRAKAVTPRAAGTAEWSAELTALGMAFRSVFRRLIRMRGRDTHLAGDELSHAQFELLIELDERGALPAGELATAAQLTPATVTQMLDHLAAGGQVERVRSETDRRVVVSRLTEQGRGKIEAKRKRWQSRWEQVLSDVDAEELRVATRVLERLSAVFEDSDDCKVQPPPPSSS
jgi:MarR family transcriptional regulator, organic hydroperoxide resistance regulator